MNFIDILFPVLAIALTGFFVAKRGWLNKQECASIAKFAFHYAIPTLLFLSTSRAKFPPDMNFAFLASYYIGAVVIFLLALFLARLILNYDARQQSVIGMGAAYSNSTIVGVPVCLQALGQDGLLPLFIIVSIHNLVMFSMGTFAAERDTASGSFLKHLIHLVKQLLTSPITFSLIAGLIVNFSGLEFYPPVEKAIEFFSEAAVPMALFALGTTLTGYRIAGQLLPSIIMSVLKIVVMPALVWLLAFKVFTLPVLWASAAVIASAMPVGVSAYVFAQRIEECEPQVAASIVISTIASLGTISVVLMVLPLH
jgi:predicted permease